MGLKIGPIDLIPSPKHLMLAHKVAGEQAQLPVRVI